MAQATTTTEGEVILAGDLAGDANLPELRASGVTPGTRSPAVRISVNSKGFITSAGQMPASEIEPFLPVATTSSKGILRLGTNLLTSPGVLDVATATSSVKGIASHGTGLTVSSGNVTLNYTALNAQIPTATGSVLGLARSGTNITNTSGVFSIEDASSSVKGVASYAPTDFTFNVQNIAVQSIIARLAVANTWGAAQNMQADTSTGISTFTPNFQTMSGSRVITLTSNLTINAPAALAPSGCVVRMDIMLIYDASAVRTVSMPSGYTTNGTLTFTNEQATTYDVLTLIATSTTCYAMINNKFL